jgi:hypothetical protein
MTLFLKGLSNVVNDRDTGVIETHIGERDGRGYIYTGVEDLHNLIGGKSQRGSYLKSEKNFGNIEINTVFTDKARHAVSTLKGTSDNDVYELMTEIDSHKKLILPINFMSVSTDGVVATVVKSNYVQDASFNISRIIAKYDPEIKRCPLKYVFTHSNTSADCLSEYLSDYLLKWNLGKTDSPSKVGSVKEIVLFSTANYIKTIVISDKSHKNQFVIDCKGCYFIKNGNVCYLGQMNNMNEVYAFIEDYSIPKKMAQYLHLYCMEIQNYRKWIVPYLCGDINTIVV